MLSNIGITFVFFIYSLIWLQLPGMLFVQLLLPRRLKVATRLLASYFLGFMYLALVYYIQSLVGCSWLITVAGPVATANFLFIYWKKGRPSIFNAGEKLSLSFIVIFVATYIISLINFKLKFIGALSGQTTQIYHDFLFHTGNIVSLSKGFPSGDIRVDGLTFYYHYFYELIFAMCKNIFHFDAFKTYLNGNALVCAWPLSLSLMIIGERLKGGRYCRPRTFFFYCIGTLVSCICLLPLNVVGGTFPVSWLDNHLFGNGNAMGLAMALTILCVDILVEVWYDKYSFKVMCAIFVLAAATTGFKGTSGVLLAAITFIVFVVEHAITRRFHWGRFLYVVATVVGFCFTYMTVTVGLSSTGSNNRAMTLTPEGTLEAGRVGQILSKLGIDYMDSPWIIPAVIAAAICIVGPCILPFVGFTVSKFKTLIHDGVIGNIFDWFVIGSVLMGVIGFCFVSVPGLSQGYFVITNAAFIFYGAMMYVIDNRGNLISHIMNGFWCLGTLFLVVDIAYFCRDDIRQHAIYKMEAGDRADLVSRDTMEAYLWLRDNTPEDAKIAVDRFSEELDYRNIYFYAGAFSERQCYLEGYDYSDISEERIGAMRAVNERFYSSDWKEADVAIEICGIDYIVVTDMGHPDYQGDNWQLDLVFENDDVRIYKYNYEAKP